MINNHSSNDPSNLLVEIPNVPTYSAASSYNHQAPIYSKPDRDSYSTPKKPKKEIDSSKAYKCPECEYSFNRRDHLTRHSLVIITFVCRFHGDFMRFVYRCTVN